MNRPVKKLIDSNSFFLLYLSIKTPEYNPQNRPKNVTAPNIKEKEEFKFSESVKYHGILIIVTPEAMPETIWAINNKNK
tara:strand:+ start:101 stop:337 length:237 start_codon:yes stop_codon:yes gene_type:complete